MAPWPCRAPAIGAAALAMALMACTAGAQSLDQDKVKALHAAAKKEGQVIIWGTQRREVEWIPAAFGKLFSGIDVQFLGDNDIAVKAIAEARAGRHQVDVYQNSLTGTLPLVQRDLLANIDWSLFGIDNRNIAFDGKMAYTSNIVYTVAYNNKLAKDADAPKNWIGHSRRALQGKGCVQHVSAAAADRRPGPRLGGRQSTPIRPRHRGENEPLCSRGPRANRCCNRVSAFTRSGRSILSFVPWPPRVFR